MNRREEFEYLLHEPTPPALEGSVRRAHARHRAARRGKLWGIPLASLGGAAAAFVLLVNFSLPFARACAAVPVLRDLASAVVFSPSLKAAVEHDFVQPVGQRQTVNGVTMTVEYLIVDQKQVNVFYTLESEEYPALDGEPDFTLSDGGEVEAMVQWGYSVGNEDSLRCITLDFSDGDVPDTLLMTYTARHVDPSVENPRKQPILAEFNFALRLDPNFTRRGEVYALNRELDLDGQKITVKTVEIYPTHLRLNLADHPENTAWLKEIDFYLEDEKGNHYEKISNGITATGDPDGTPFMPSHRLESSYFGDTKHLKLFLTGAVWLDKGSEHLTLDIAGGTARNLPQGVALGKVERRGDDVDVTLVVHSRDGVSRSVIQNGWLDIKGRRHEIGRTSFGSPFEEARTADGIYYPAGSSYESFTLKDCLWNQVQLGVSFSRYGDLHSPIEIPVK